MTGNPLKTYHVEALGCAKNQVDAEELMACLQTRGMSRAAPEDADCIIVQSCGFIESAKQESLDTVFELRRYYPGKKIILTGCLARRYETELRGELVEADAVFGENSPSRLAALISENGAASVPVISGERPLLSLPGSAYLKIAEGCDNHCSFCAIPLMRGHLRSRPIADITAEFQSLTRRGIRELCLIAQDTASFGIDNAGRPLIGELLSSLLQIEGSYWIRLLYLHPDHFPLEILPLMRADKRLLPYFDIPFQHASKKILALMGRRGDSDRYLDLIASIRGALPDAVLRSTFLTGFPGETEEDFAILRHFQNDALLDWAGVFAYSHEEGTAAFTLPSRPSKKLALQRKRQLEEAQQPVTEARLERRIGSLLEALVEEAIDTEAGLYVGRGYLHAPEVDGAMVIESSRVIEPGTVVPVTVTGRAGFDLRCGH